MLSSYLYLQDPAQLVYLCSIVFSVIETGAILYPPLISSTSLSVTFFFCPSWKQLLNKFLSQIHANQTWRPLLVSMLTFCVLLLISLISADMSGDAIVFVSQAWTLEHRLIGYGWIIHSNHRIAAWLCGPCQWLSWGGVDGPSAGKTHQ